MLRGPGAVDHHAHLLEVVISLGGPPGQPGRLSEAQLGADQQGVGGMLAGAVAVVVLQGAEVAAGVEGVGTRQELRAGPHLTPAQGTDGEGEGGMSVEVALLDDVMFANTNKVC